jgi:hypothetical protein
MAAALTSWTVESLAHFTTARERTFFEYVYLLFFGCLELTIEKGAARVLKEIMELDPTQINFSLVALTASQE